MAETHLAGFWGHPQRRVAPACGTNTHVPAGPVTASLGKVTCGTCRRKLAAGDPVVKLRMTSYARQVSRG